MATTELTYRDRLDALHALKLERTGENDEQGLARTEALIQDHFDMGGALVNINVLDREQVPAAHRNPADHPDLIVRVTGFSAYFANLSEKLREYVVERIVAGE